MGLGGLAGALLVAHQDVLYFALLENLVRDRKHRAAGIAEQVLDAMIDQRAHDHGGAGHLVRIVAFLTHGLLRIALPPRFWVLGLGLAVSVLGSRSWGLGPGSRSWTLEVLDSWV